MLIIRRPAERSGLGSRRQSAAVAENLSTTRSSIEVSRDCLSGSNIVGAQRVVVVSSGRRLR